MFSILFLVNFNIFLLVFGNFCLDTFCRIRSSVYNDLWLLIRIQTKRFSGPWLVTEFPIFSSNINTIPLHIYLVSNFDAITCFTFYILTKSDYCYLSEKLEGDPWRSGAESHVCRDDVHSTLQFSKQYRMKEQIWCSAHPRRPSFHFYINREMMQALKGGEGDWRPLGLGVVATEVFRTCSVSIVITNSGSNGACPTSGRTPSDGLQLLVGSLQPSPLIGSPSNGLARSDWQPASTGAKVANVPTRIN